MSRIRILPEILSNKIAAGEVVERPASVVKELVENALDASARRIEINIEKGGRRLIEVSDNGAGMGKDDAMLAIERYATSKIVDDEDLFSIRTLGFRGEALPSIASVSKFTMLTRQPSSELGTRISIAGGKVREVTECGAAPGTMIRVENLFFNTPARRKFMKTISTEMGHIADVTASMALGWPEVYFRLTHNGKVIKNWSAASDPKNRVAAVLGAAVKEALFTVDSRDGYVSINGWIGSPQIVRSTSRGIFVFVNGRFVKDRVIQHALFDGYTGRLMKGQYPVAVLNLDLDFDQVDVNVHPTKHEVRFTRQKQVHDAVREIVARTLAESDRHGWPDDPADSHEVENPTSGSGRVSEAAGRPAYEKNFRGSGYYKGNKGISAGRGFNRSSDFSPQFRQNEWQHRSGESLENKENKWPPPEVQTDHEPSGQAYHKTTQTDLWKKSLFGNLTIIGQYHETYILCESPDGLVVIDQHAAHERIAFERLKTQYASARPESQKQLIPESIELGFREAQILQTLIPELEKFGLDIEPFGGNTFVVTAIPLLLDSSAVNTVITEIVEKSAAIGVNTGTQKLLDECLMLMACHSTIRANHRLSREQMQLLLKQLDACDNPSHCPHGRPTWIRWTLKDLEKLFHRIV